MRKSAILSAIILVLLLSMTAIVGCDTLSIEIESVTSPVCPGEDATLEASTTPGATCDIEVHYMSGLSEASGLYTKTADSDGYVSWTWKVGTNTTPGDWDIVASASHDSQTASDTTQFTVEFCLPSTTLSIEIVDVTSPVCPGESATLQALTTPGVSCDITVYYMYGPSEASGLYTKMADSDGCVSWTWTVGTNTTPGDWDIVVSASYGLQTASDTTQFTVESCEEEKASTELTIEIVYVTSPVNAGANATLQALTTPGALCDITVYYKSGPSTASGLYTKTADSDGYVSWTWKVGTRTTPGSWKIVVSASYDSQTASDTIYFTVQ